LSSFGIIMMMVAQQQRIDSVKSGMVGAVSASMGSAVLLALHDTSLQQWEFDVDMAAISGGLFAIVYRYCCLRQYYDTATPTNDNDNDDDPTDDDENDDTTTDNRNNMMIINRSQLSQGVVGAFGLTRTFGRIHVPVEACDALPLSCGPPLGYWNRDMIFQLVWNGTESFAMFGVAALAMEIVTERGFISRIPK
jgi:hypothetical protein